MFRRNFIASLLSFIPAWLLPKRPSTDGMTIADVIQRVDDADAWPMFGRWISVKDRIPDMDCIEKPAILILSLGQVFAGICWQHEDGTINWEDHQQRRFKDGNVTHWMPLPGPPSLREQKGE